MIIRLSHWIRCTYARTHTRIHTQTQLHHIKNVNHCSTIEVSTLTKQYNANRVLLLLCHIHSNPYHMYVYVVGWQRLWHFRNYRLIFIEIATTDNAHTHFFPEIDWIACVYVSRSLIIYLLQIDSNFGMFEMHFHHSCTNAAVNT